MAEKIEFPYEIKNVTEEEDKLIKKYYKGTSNLHSLYPQRKFKYIFKLNKPSHLASSFLRVLIIRMYLRT